jgi:hypothetical protein
MTWKIKIEGDEYIAGLPISVDWGAADSLVIGSLAK